ncbi:hypothetical protein COS31_01955 [Candidatus Roizmanbacteria bacterium CG02_land_8_20_14_3_00_36_15]|uniref:Uncharacterized protein n=1 Tax=Candidatus Roizmanbacteria bacterium CG10_big_fil_rev_8_21_14_0_10_36_26 TaxID=1974851 RepID=A0A2M8KM13_9BACT|nr:MAG: hypothetical protein COS51_01730 [Candidatus Roizmanbacteria bacterium CG03_land_8_20_14_0_80_36_21]PIV37985.1 MAG: hypothetical protein COS31_01955 [Candidatus Roizmanbacteria bacterium CG02_land_8_20_14_3_00_36_15]PIY69987.1 MAG: hypothetical protein COY89_03665 [Candidatus Roizmanbacteria bacterium CG_4_10_14_0_8_um_filter_36_36]PJE60963.1 MAG: hypothetical protein COU86_01680 [Candidatus Roizmanbacteria bacterium CG10_big_fil_rev_8_21_14_0_10_36_26]
MPNIKETLRSRIIRVGTAMIMIAIVGLACKGIPYLYEIINKGDTIWVKPGGARGANSAGKCSVPEGYWIVQETDNDDPVPEILVDDCWLEADSWDFSTHPPKPTLTRTPTKSPFWPLNPQGTPLSPTPDSNS